MPLPRLFAVTLLALGMTSSIASAQLLPERLVPPQQFMIPALPMTEKPSARSPAGADKLPAHLWALPMGAFPGSPTAIATEQLPADWKRPVVDAPLLASESDPPRPAAPRQPIAPSAFALAADPMKTHTLDRFPLPTEPPTRAVDDPTGASVHTLITLAVSLASPNAAPFLRLSVADPFEHLRAIRLAVPPVDSDLPDVTRELPPRPMLATTAPTK